MTRAEIEHDFRLYWLDLAADAGREGYAVDRDEQWVWYIEAGVDNGVYPEEATKWETPAK